MTSAFLLFQVQPVISKKILPWFGGSPAVWTTCVLFFQLVLLGGYAYAHAIIRYVPPRRQGLIHIAVLLAALATLPITPAESWKPVDGNYPALRILTLLAAKVGMPFFVASATGPLVQAWFSQLYPGCSAYRLYALSNFGSLAALLTYPVLIETWLSADRQGLLWSWGFGGLALLIGFLAFAVSRQARQPEQRGVDGSPAADEFHPVDPPPSLWLRVWWLSLAALASMALLAITNHLCQDIAVVPFLWVIPLSLYLLSFIICFDNERWYLRRLVATSTILAILWLTATRQYPAVDSAILAAQDAVVGAREESILGKPRITFTQLNNAFLHGMGWLVEKIDRAIHTMTAPSFHLVFEAGTAEFEEYVVAASAAYLLILFLICMVCHGELVKSKPQPSHLTSFYLSISAGGALGGLWVALICPLVFTRHFELPMSLVSGFVVAGIALISAGHAARLSIRRICRWIGASLLVVGAVLVARGNIEQPDLDVIAIERNFYGTVTVSTMLDEEDSTNDGRSLYHGRIWHGFQFLDPARQLEPAAYYVEGTGAELSINRFPSRETILPKSAEQPQQWRYTTNRPDGTWQQADYEDSGWLAGKGGFGNPAVPGAEVGTPWAGGDLWLRRTFDSTEPGGGLQILLRCNVYCDVYLNGRRLPIAGDATADYARLPLGALLSEAVVAGKNCLAIHCHAYANSEPFVDAGLERRRPLRVAVFGLGAGAMAVHARRGDLFRFYEIDPKVVEVARKYFTYLEKSPATLEVVLGDARIALEREYKQRGNQNFDVIHLDAFSGDAVPAHLLTAEAFELYERNLRKGSDGKPAGVIVVHISNRYLDLAPVVAAMARRYDYRALSIQKGQGPNPTDTLSDWVLLTKNAQFVNDPLVQVASEPLAAAKELLWTDQFTPLFPLLQ